MKEWFATHNGCEIRVANSWFGFSKLYKLYIDGDLRDTNVRKLVASHSGRVKRACYTCELRTIFGGCLPEGPRNR